MIERVFRVCRYTSFDKKRWNLKKKALFDNEQSFRKAVRKHAHDCDRFHNYSVLHMCFTGEEFLSGKWVQLSRYPVEEGFSEEEDTTNKRRAKEAASETRSASRAAIAKDAEDAWQQTLEKRNRSEN